MKVFNVLNKYLSLHCQSQTKIHKQTKRKDKKMEKSKKLTIEEIRKAQDLQAELFGMVSTKIGHATYWNVSLDLRELQGYNEEYAKIYVIIHNDTGQAFYEQATLTEWADLETFDNLKAKLTEYINENYQ